ncbi:MAG: AAA-like domain-containing protein [Caldilineaceae bacterium]
MPPNPFIYGPPVQPANLIGRRSIIRRIVGRIINQGQSTALIGEPHLGKTSLLTYLTAPEKRNELYGATASQLIFSSLDSQALGGDFTPAHFWAHALQPLRSQLIDTAPTSPVTQQFSVCQANGFGTFTLETLFQRVHAAGYRLVLLIDEFDTLLHHPILNSAEFFGGMRALASRSQGALALVVASRLPLAKLNADTQAFNPSGSPYFNIFGEVTLGAFSEEDCKTLLKLAGDRFTATDQRYLQQLTGGHPYLLQAAAAALWDAYEDGLTDAATRNHRVFEQLYRDHDQHFADTWRAWTPVHRQAFTCVALVNARGLLQQHKLDINSLLESIANLTPELKDLEQSGVVAPLPGALGGWVVTQRILLAWLADELIRHIRNETDFSQWLQGAELEGRWTRRQREQLWNVGRVLYQGVKELQDILHVGIDIKLGG